MRMPCSAACLCAAQRAVNHSRRAAPPKIIPSPTHHLQVMSTTHIILTLHTCKSAEMLNMKMKRMVMKECHPTSISLMKRCLSTATPPMTGEEIVKSCREYTMWSWSAQQVETLHFFLSYSFLSRLLIQL
jgi:hypothetical protein